LSFGGGLIGLVFTAGSALIFVLGFPTLWYFVALAFGLGVAIAVFLRLVSQKRSERNRPLSILQIPANREKLVFSRRAKIPQQFRLEAQPTSA
jgi:hypothetical protein